ncbi:MAG: SDR family NAD(P)-dependent oxidoreductase [Solirubrobacterales bacterium]
MASIEASELLRPGLLHGVSVLIAGDAPAAGAQRARTAAGTPAGATAATQSPPAQSPPASLGASAHGVCAELGARVCAVGPIGDSSPGDEDAAMAEMVEAAVAELGGVAVLVVDAAGVFAARVTGATANASEGEQDRARAALRRCLAAAWSVTRAAVNVAFLPGEQGGRIVYLAPRPLSGAHAGAACAGLENLARTLSIEWARHAITTVVIAPGDATSGEEVGALTAYLASPAGSYFSGCLLDLRVPAAR